MSQKFRLPWMESRCSEMAGVVNIPYVIKAGELLSSIMLFLMYTNSHNYDLYFFTPALTSFRDAPNRNSTQIDQYKKLENFLIEEFTIQKYAANFNFSKTETADTFLLRFLKHLESQETIPQDVKESIVALESYKYMFINPFLSKGFIKPCPMYVLTRITTLLAELSYGLKQIEKDDHVDSLNTIIQFLTEGFEPSIHGEGLDLNNENVQNIVLSAFFGFAAEENKDERLILVDGVQASTKNKQFFKHILPKVPENVKQAIDTILPYL